MLRGVPGLKGSRMPLQPPLMHKHKGFPLGRSLDGTALEAPRQRHCQSSTPARIEKEAGLALLP